MIRLNAMGRITRRRSLPSVASFLQLGFSSRNLFSYLLTLMTYTVLICQVGVIYKFPSEISWVSDHHISILEMEMEEYYLAVLRNSIINGRVMNLYGRARLKALRDTEELIVLPPYLANTETVERQWGHPGVPSYSVSSPYVMRTSNVGHRHMNRETQQLYKRMQKTIIVGEDGNYHSVPEDYIPPSPKLQRLPQRHRVCPVAEKLSKKEPNYVFPDSGLGTWASGAEQNGNK